MNVKNAILLTLTRGQLKKVAERIGLVDVDLTNVNELTERLSKHPSVNAELLLGYLPEASVGEACRYVPLTAPHTRRALAEAAHIERDIPIDTQVEAREAPVGAVIADETTDIVAGALVEWQKQVGVVESVDGKVVRVRFDSGAVMNFNRIAGALKRILFTQGMQVRRVADGNIGVILAEAASGGYPTWRAAFPGSVVNIAEMGLRPAIVGDPIQRFRSGQLGTATEFNLKSVAADYWTAHHHNVLVSLSNARVDLKPYQVSVVHRVISNYPHRFMLADEVGLGKTIEAAMIIKELRARGQARRVLVLVPSGLTRQWQFELKTKFNETFAIYNSSTVRYLRDKGVANPWNENDSVIASHSWASWSPDRIRDISQVAWDLVIVDEAHHARVHADGTRTLLFKLVQDLVARREFGRRAALFLTATPLQLDRGELYSLVEMLDPVLFVSAEDFSAHIQSLGGLNRTVELLQGHAAGDDLARWGVLYDIARFLEIDVAAAETLVRDQGVAAVAEMLRGRHRLSEVLIRNRKSVVQGFQPRHAFRWEVTLSDEERFVHERMETVFQRGFELAEETNQNVVGFLMVTLQKLLASSSRALVKSLQKRGAKPGGDHPVALAITEAEQELESDAAAADVVAGIAPHVSPKINNFDGVIELLEKIDIDSKAAVLVANLKELFEEERNGKVLIFTEFRETQEMLTDLLGSIAKIHKFHGQMSPIEKDEAVDAFRIGSGPQILVSTEAGGEGRNFQFCHNLVNYDLPWNPMKVEQRIGRIDRIGQDHPIMIFNLHVQGTIEGRILDVLERRIGIFEEAVGGLDPILGKTEAGIRDALKLARADREIAIRDLEERLEREVEAARNAELKFQDFILQDKSYQAEIAQKAAQAEAPIREADFEKFLTQLLSSVRTFIGPRQPTGERRIVFHGPFVLEHPDLIQGQESRRVCFDPRTHIDSELVEFLGFGHPIIDALVKSVIYERYEGGAAVRRVDGFETRGWQFNWLIKVGGLRPREFLYSVFVDEAGRVDEAKGEELVLRSRQFGHEVYAGEVSIDGLDGAFAAADKAAADRRDRELADARALAQERAYTEEQRLRSLMQHRTTAANDRIASCRATLQRLQAATDPLVRQAIQLWEANLARAEGELEAVRNDLEESLVQLNKKRNPTGESSLLSVARIEVERSDIGSSSNGG